ncbi:MAG: hypothetical protein PHS49_02795 [Candidatus Gracilibacteria bacterium]|nr:hypothetical protein [Candidatus Gracilibacteria bacterium]
MSKNNINLSEHYFISYFKDLLSIKYAYEITNFLLKKSKLSIGDFEKKWDSYDLIFGKEYGNKISALSFATIIEARGILLNNILKSREIDNNLIVELASGFTPRGLNLVNKGTTNYIETDKENVIKLKHNFYEYLNSIDIKTPQIKTLDVLDRHHFKELYDLIKVEKLKNNNLEQITLLSEGLVIYLDKIEQKQFFDNLRELAKLLKEINIKMTYLTIDMPTHENFTNWLVHEDFSLKDHLDVMSKVEPKIIESLHNTQNDFTTYNSLGELKKYYYDEEIITSLKTPKLAKYKKIKNLKEKINTFLKQDILFAWEVEI